MVPAALIYIGRMDLRIMDGLSFIILVCMGCQFCIFIIQVFEYNNIFSGEFGLSLIHIFLLYCDRSGFHWFVDRNRSCSRTMIDRNITGFVVSFRSRPFLYSIITKIQGLWCCISISISCNGIYDTVSAVNINYSPLQRVFAIAICVSLICRTFVDLDLSTCLWDFNGLCLRPCCSTTRTLSLIHIWKRKLRQDIIFQQILQPYRSTPTRPQQLWILQRKWQHFRHWISCFWRRRMRRLTVLRHRGLEPLDVYKRQGITGSLNLPHSWSPWPRSFWSFLKPSASIHTLWSPGLWSQWSIQVQ